MKNNIIFEKAKNLLKKYNSDKTGHGIDHALRVCENAEKISKIEGGNILIIKLAALLHDVDDRKVNKTSISYLQKILNKLDLSKKDKEHITHIIENQSFRLNINSENKIKTIEGKIVQDSDRLEGIGAIGVSRALTYGGKKRRAIFDENIKPISFQNKKEYISNEEKSTTINHFFEKLLILRDLMNTSAAKKIAQSKQKFMVFFLEQFFKDYKFKSKDNKQYWFSLLNKYK